MNRSYAQYLLNKYVATGILVAGAVGLWALSTHMANIHTKYLPLFILVGIVGFVVANAIDLDRRSMFVSSYEQYWQLCYIGVFSLVGVLGIVGASVGRPLWMHVALAIVWGFILFDVFFHEDASATRLGVILGAIVAAGTLQSTLGYVNTALYVGVDMFGHVSMVSDLIEANSLDGLASTKYYYSPFHHIATAILSVAVIGQTYASLWVLLTVTQIVFTLGAFSIGREIINYRAGLLAATLFLTADYVIKWSIEVQPTTVGLLFYVVLVYALVKAVTTRGNAFIGLVFVLLASVAFTHQVSLFIAVVTVVVFLTWFEVTTSRSRSYVPVSAFALLLVYLSFTITHYLGPAGPNVDFFERMLTIVYDSIVLDESGAGEFTLAAEYQFTGIASATEWSVLGIGLLVLVMTCGYLFACKYDRSVRQLSFLGIGVTAGLVSVAAFFGPVIGMDALVPTRWFAFIYLHFAVLASMLAVPWGGRASVGTVVVVFLAVTSVFFMSIAPAGAPDEIVLSNDPTAERQSLTEPERAALEFHSDHGAGAPLVADARLQYPAAYFGIDAETLAIDHDANEDNFEPETRSLVYRDYMNTPQNIHRYQSGDDGEAYVYGPVDEARFEGHNRVYDNEVAVYT